MDPALPAPTLPQLLAPGTRLGRYHLLRRVAIGGMAELYLARATGIEGFEKLVALKRILPHFAANEELVSMFLDEARLAATIHHGNVAQVYDIGRSDAGLYFTMEYVHGEDVRRVLNAATAGGGLPLEHATFIACAVAAGLHAAHELTASDGAPLGIVHRDVSPANVLVSYAGDVKLIDFGIAKAARRQAETGSGTVKGKASYMSPEQCVGAAVDRRSDVFSLGILLWEMTVGRRLYTAESDYAVLRLIVDHDAPRPSTLIAGYPAELEAIVMRALARTPEERYSTAQELQLALEGFARSHGLAMSPVALGRHMSTLFPGRAALRPDAVETPRRRTVRRTQPRLRPGTDLEVSIQLDAPLVEIAADLAAEVAPPRAIGSGAIDTSMFDVAMAEPAVEPSRPRSRWATTAIAAVIAIVAGFLVQAEGPLPPRQAVASERPPAVVPSTPVPVPSAPPSPPAVAAPAEDRPSVETAEEATPARTRRRGASRPEQRRRPGVRAPSLDPDATLPVF